MAASRSRSSLLWFIIPLLTLIVLIVVGMRTKDLASLGMAERHKSSLISGDPTLDLETLEVAKWIYEQRLAHYQSVTAEMHKTVIAFAVLVMFGLIVLVKNPKDLQFPLLGIHLSRGFMHWIIPLSLLYLWIQFGFLLFSAIDSRSSLYTLATETIEHISVHHYHSSKHSLEDVGIVDAWANFFLGHYPSITDWVSKWTVGLSLYGIFGTLLGLVHGVIIQLLVALRRRIPESKSYANVLIMICLIMLVLSHMTFGSRLPYGLSLQCWIWIVAFCFIAGGRGLDSARV